MKKFDPAENTIFLDMDGVLADLYAYAEKVDRHGNIYRTMNSDPHVFLKLPPTPYAHELWEMAHSVGANVEILTAIPKSAKVPYARPDKEEWIRKHFSKTINVRFGPYSQDKWKHAAPGDILIDDMPSNIESWVTRGRGIGILHNYYDFPKTKKIFSELTKF